MTKRAKSPNKSKGKPKSKRKLNLSSARRKRHVIVERPVTRVPAWLEPADPLDSLIDASAQALALPLDPAWKGAVKANLDVTLRLAGAYADFPLPDDAEPAPVFTA
jgi:1-carboxybiuret hydrolase subunit AtzG-like